MEAWNFRQDLTSSRHAGYSYSGPCAAWAYKALDVSKAERIFLLGPSHRIYLNNCALSDRKQYATPFGNFDIDTEVVEELRNTGHFASWSYSDEEKEHSLEMHLPYIYKTLQNSPAFADRPFPKLIPILVGNTDSRKEQLFGELLANYLKDPTSVFVISSDFCHWGERFSYTRYLPKGGPPDGIDLVDPNKPVTNPQIHESIGELDARCMTAIATGEHAAFQNELRKTKNTVCGRHPIAIIMCAIECLRERNIISQDEGRFKWLNYDRSSDVTDLDDSSVSYVSGCAMIDCRKGE